MNRDDIIRMAQEADVWIVGQEPYQAQLERFASLVAAHEREACAELCEETEPFYGVMFAKAIRERSEK
jgi:hypothetical protein